MFRLKYGYYWLLLVICIVKIGRVKAEQKTFEKIFGTKRTMCKVWVKGGVFAEETGVIRKTLNSLNQEKKEDAYQKSARPSITDPWMQQYESFI